MGEYELSRSIEIEAPPERILDLLTSFREWRRWSPFEQQDADLEREYRGAERGIGAVYDYQGQRSGAGTLEITGVSDRHVHVRTTFSKPFKTVSEHEFQLRADGETTQVSWRMVGTQNAFTKLVFPAAKFLGPVFDQGLQQLKGVAEG